MSTPKKYSLWLTTRAYSLLIGLALLSLSLILGHSFLSQKDIESISLHLAAPQIAPMARALSFACPNSWPLRRAFIAYEGEPTHYSDQLLDALAPRFAFSSQINSYNSTQLKQRNPNFYSVVYNSLSDNYAGTGTTPGTGENGWYFAHASEYGADPEDTYLHFWTDTEVRLEG